MFKKALCLFFIVSCMPQAYAATVYQLAAGQSLQVTNTTGSAISASCQITAVSNVINTLVIKILRGQGSINGTSFTQGQTLNEIVYNTQVIPVFASARAIAQITNNTKYTMVATCY